MKSKDLLLLASVAVIAYLLLKKRNKNIIDINPPLEQNMPTESSASTNTSIKEEPKTIKLNLNNERSRSNGYSRNSFFRDFDYSQNATIAPAPVQIY